jgi:hypothetical protein
MDVFDFSAFYMICGPDMKDFTINLLRTNHNELMAHNYITNNNVEHLLSLNDTEFEDVYLNTYMIVNNLLCDVKTHARITSNNQNINQVFGACLSNISLIQRCQSISMIPLNNCVKLMKNTDTINIDIKDNYIYLYENGFDIVGLLAIVHRANNYHAMKFLLDNMSNVDLAAVLDLFLSNKFKGLIRVLIIDIIYKQGDNYLKKLCRYTCLANDIDIFTTCYLIINHTSIELGKKYIDRVINKYNNDALISVQLNALLEFHFRPRGAYTKCATLN